MEFCLGFVDHGITINL